MSASNTTHLNTSPNTRQQTDPAADTRTTKRLVLTTAYFTQSKDTQTMYILDKDSPQGRILQRHRSEWSRQECICFIQENATSTQPYIDWSNQQTAESTPQPHS